MCKRPIISALQIWSINHFRHMFQVCGLNIFLLSTYVLSVYIKLADCETFPNLRYKFISATIDQRIYLLPTDVRDMLNITNKTFRFLAVNGLIQLFIQVLMAIDLLRKNRLDREWIFIISIMNSINKVFFSLNIVLRKFWERKKIMVLVKLLTKYKRTNSIGLVRLNKAEYSGSLCSPSIYKTIA